jgi:phage-related protein
MNMGGEFPVLYPGENVIEFTGNINQVILTPRWRAL